MSIHDTIAQTCRELRDTAKHTPEIFPAWQLLQQKKAALEKAQGEYDRAQTFWDNFLKGAE